MKQNRSTHQLPNKLLLTDGAVDMRKVAYIQKIQSKEGTLEHQTYNKHWDELLSEVHKEGEVTKRNFSNRVNKLGDSRLVEKEQGYENESVIKGYKSESQVIEEGVSEQERETSEQINQWLTGGESVYEEGFDTEEDVWVGIILEEGESHYKVEEVYGRGLTKKDVIKLKSDRELYKEFSIKCWSGYLGVELYSEEELQVMLAEILDVDLSEVLGTKVDLEYVVEQDEDITGGEVYVSFKARIDRRGL